MPPQNDYCFVLQKPEDASMVAASMIEKYADARVFAFVGSMGVGKTTLIKALCSRLSVSDTVSSPSFSVVNEYLCENGDLVYHFDFYRLKDELEAWRLGIHELLDSGNYCFIEWPLIAKNILPLETLWFEIVVDDKNELRTIKLQKPSS